MIQEPTLRPERNITYYCNCFERLQVGNKKNGGKALNQPILLLSIIDLIAKNRISHNIILISDELIDTFKLYWSILVGIRFKSSDFALPFFHLKNAEGKFWQLEFSNRYEGGRPQTIPTLKRDVDLAYIDLELLVILKHETSRQEIIESLIASWFDRQKKELDELLSLNTAFQKKIEEQLIDYGGKPKISIRESLIRNAFFRKSIVHVYDYKCAFCKLKVTKNITQRIVDAAHIKPFSIFYDCRINNGISFCKNHHWGFDRGWFSIDDNYKIIVTNNLDESCPHSKPIIDFHGESIFLPSDTKCLPDINAIKWHRDNIYQV